MEVPEAKPRLMAKHRPRKAFRGFAYSFQEGCGEPSGQAAQLPHRAGHTRTHALVMRWD